MSQQKITFIGAGNMASALIGGLIANGISANNIIASDLDTDKLATLAQQFGIQTSTNNQQAVNSADVVVLAVKPQVMRAVANDLQSPIQQQQPLVISVAAGIRADALDVWLGGNVALIRCMPNTPALLKKGMTGLYANKQASPSQQALAENLLNAVGQTLWVVNEDAMDAVTAVSGSGPAYFFLVIEAMQQAAQALGLDADTARQLTLQTAVGATQMAKESEDSVATLRAKVTSPGGTTERAINTLEENDLRTIFIQALKAAHDRSIELSKQLAQ